MKQTYFVAEVLLSIFNILGLSAQTVKMANVIPDIDLKTSSDSITTTGINSVWEPSSDEANPSSITIMKIKATSAPKILITPTSSTSQKKEMPSSSSILSDGLVDLQQSKSSSSSKLHSRGDENNPKKTSEKKIESLQSSSSDTSNDITNTVKAKNKENRSDKNIDEIIQKQSELLHEFETKKMIKVESSSSISLSSTTAKDLIENDETDIRETSSDDNLQIPSLASSSSLSESADVSSLDPTPLDVPTSWSLTSTQSETNMASKLESVSYISI